jgi:4-amino-4-deoxy-L-arabinose transferase-like glycosyltransferase
MISKLAALPVAGFVAFMYLTGIGSNPAGLFCDEAMIGLQAARLLSGEHVLTPNVFFYQHFGNNRLGSLAVFATAPFVALFGATDMSIRLPSAVLMLATVAVIYLTLRRLETPFAIVPAALFATSPIVVHLARINFAHGPSFLALAIAYWLYVEARLRRSLGYAVVAGTALGLSAYGYSGFLITAPLLLLSTLVVELAWNRRRWREYAVAAVVTAMCALWFVPVLRRMMTDETFFERMRMKGLATAGMPLGEHLWLMIRNYPKYFSYDFLFARGESGMPGGFISRHSVLGAGELSRAAIPLLALGCVGFVLCFRHPLARFFAPFLLFAALYPIPDLITTSDGRPPYVFAVAGGAIAIPFLAGIGMHGLAALFRASPAGQPAVSAAHAGAAGGSPPRDVSTPASRLWLLRIVAITFLFVVVGSGWRFWSGPYQRYPLVSADYWGWQYGPGPMISYFLAHHDDYDQFVMDGDFNEAWVFLDLYIRDPVIRRKAMIGDLSLLDPSKRQLFGVRAERWQSLAQATPLLENVLRVRAVVRYPNGQDAMYVLDVDPAGAAAIGP